MQRCYRVRDDLANATLTKFLPETNNYVSERDKSSRYKFSS